MYLSIFALVVSLLVPAYTYAADQIQAPDTKAACCQMHNGHGDHGAGAGCCGDACEHCKDGNCAGCCKDGTCQDGCCKEACCADGCCADGCCAGHKEGACAGCAGADAGCCKKDALKR
jgi:hypothetical protein